MKHGAQRQIDADVKDVEQQANERQRPDPNPGDHAEKLRAEDETVEYEGVIANRVPCSLHEPRKRGHHIVSAIEPDDDCGLRGVAEQPSPWGRTSGLKLR